MGHLPDSYKAWGELLATINGLKMGFSDVGQSGTRLVREVELMVMD